MSRPDDLARALQALKNCEPPPDEIIVSDDSPEDDRRTEAACRAVAGVRYQIGPRRGLSANRNACINASTGEWLHFIDDDVVPHPRLYCVCQAMIERYPGQTVFTGWQIDHDSRSGSIQIAEIRPPRHDFWAHMMPATEQDFNCVVMNAALFPSSLFQKIRFDEFLRYGCEESDISIHAASVGYKLRFVPELCVNHYPSALNRTTNAQSVIKSSVYAGIKRQWMFRRTVVGTIAFIAIAIPRLLLSTLRHQGLSACINAQRQASEGMTHFFLNAASLRTASAAADGHGL